MRTPRKHLKTTKKMKKNLFKKKTHTKKRLKNYKKNEKNLLKKSPYKKDLKTRKKC